MNISEIPKTYIVKNYLTYVYIEIYTVKVTQDPRDRLDICRQNLESQQQKTTSATYEHLMQIDILHRNFHYLFSNNHLIYFKFAGKYNTGRMKHLVLDGRLDMDYFKHNVINFLLKP